MTIVIAEAGVNHNGNDSIAFELIDAAFEAGADIVKFQTFKAKNLATTNAKQAGYVTASAGIKESHFSMLKRLELSYELHYKLVDHCNKLGIGFLSTAFDSESLDFLANDLGLRSLKIPSGEITNYPLVLQYAQTGCDLIISTGMSTLEEIEGVLGVVAYGYISKQNVQPSLQAFSSAYSSDEGQYALAKKVKILHCTSEYPAPLVDINLHAMHTLKSTFKLPVGYSDHSEGVTVPIAAAALGAEIIEKHFTLDRNMEGPDHRASVEPEELKQMVDLIRQVEVILGDGVKRSCPSEEKNKNIIRKSIVAACQIAEGENFSPEKIDIKRPGDGMSPAKYWELQSKIATRNYDEGELIVE